MVRHAGQAPTRIGRLDLLLFCAVLAIEAVLFLVYAEREILWHQPENYDQAVYLVSSYQIERGLRGGDFAGVWPLLAYSVDMALQVEGAVLGLVFNSDRLARLAVNFLVFAAAQGALVMTVWRLTGQRLFAVATLGLWLSQLWWWQAAGGLFDFRADFSAACLFGIWVCAMVTAPGRPLGRAVALCVAAALAVVLQRIVAASYIIAILAGFCLVSILAALGAPGREAQRRLQHTLWTFALTVVLVALYGGLKWPQVSEYYVLGHLVGDEKLARAHELGLFSLVDHLVFYWRNLADTQAGVGFMGLAALALAVSAVVAAGGVRRLWPQIVLCALAVVGPLAILGIDVSKSTVVASIVGMPLAIGIGLVASSSTLHLPKLGRALAMVLALGGGATALWHWAQPLYSDARRDLTAVTDLALAVHEAMLRSGLVDQATLSVDAMSPLINAAAMTVTIHERTGALPTLHMGLGAHVDAIDSATHAADLARSQMVITTPFAGLGELPFDRSMRALAPQFAAIVARDFTLAATFPLSAGAVRLYVRRAAP